MIKKFITNIFNKLGVESFRTKNIFLHLLSSAIFKGGTVVANFLLVPLTIQYLGNSSYGVWLTLSSFIIWFSFLDIGLGNGLRNKVAEIDIRSNTKTARYYISSAYISISLISLLLFFIFLLINRFVDWSVIFNAGEDLSHDLQLLMPIIFGFFSFQLVLKLISSIYLGDQNHSIDIKIQFFTQIISLLVIWILSRTSESSILLFGTLYSVTPLLLLLFLNFFSFNFDFKDLIPSFKYWSKEHVDKLLGIGFSFFIIQISWLVVFSTDNLLISWLFSPAEVVPYSVSQKYFSILTVGYTILVTPYWSSFTDAYYKKDFDWIKSSVKTIVKIWLLIPFALVFMLLISEWFYGVWIGDEVKISLSLSIGMAVYTLLQTFNLIFTYFVNGVGKIKLQLFIAVASMIINIPLSIFFAKSLGFGTVGVIYATSCSLILTSVTSPIQYLKIVNNKARGIWNS